MIEYEKEIIEYLNLPSIPVRKWDGRSSFKKAVAETKLVSGGSAYAVATFDSERDKSPRIIKVFSIEQYSGFEIIGVVPEYMDTEGVEHWDLDDASKKAAESLIEEGRELEEEGIVEESAYETKNEYLYEHIHNDEEARAFIKAWNAKNGVRKSREPRSHDDIVAKLTSMWINDNKKNK